MTGIFLNQPDGGVSHDATQMAFDPHNSPSCDALFYPATGCSVQIKNAWLNAIISEIACAIDGSGLAIKCDAVCNLSSAIMTTGTVSGYCAADEAGAAAQKGSALATGDAWLNTATMVASYVDGDGVSVAYPRQPEVFVCCKTGKIFVRCGNAYTHLPGSGDIQNLRLEGICATSQQSAEAAGLQAGDMWIDTDASPRVVYVYDGSSSVPVSPQPDFFACCNTKSLWVRCGGDYFDPADCPPQTGGGDAGFWTGLTTEVKYMDTSSVGNPYKSQLRLPPDNPARKVIVITNTVADNAPVAVTAVHIGAHAGQKITEITVENGTLRYSLALWLVAVPDGGLSQELRFDFQANCWFSARCITVFTAQSGPHHVAIENPPSTSPFTITSQCDGPCLVVAGGCAHMNDPSWGAPYTGEPWAPKKMVAPGGINNDETRPGGPDNPLGTAVAFTNEATYDATYECNSGTCDASTFGVIQAVFKLT